MNIAFKEWAVVCRALATGRQSLIIRKGGISEEGGVFRPEHSHFWLYPTHFHEQQQKGIKPAAESLLAEAEANRAPSGQLLITHAVEVAEVFYLEKLEQALALDDRHIWSPETITQRFHYRSPGLYVLTVRVWKCPSGDIIEHPEYAGCKTWVELKESLPTEPREAVLTETEFAKEMTAIRERLHRS